MTETADTQAPAAAPATPPTARFPLPTGVVTPIELRNELVKQGIAAATLKPQQMYAYVKAPGKNDPFPVKWYDAEGTAYDKQPAGDNAPLTRPGVPTIDLGIEWYQRRATRPAATATATVTATAPPQVTDAAEDESDGSLEDGGEFEEAE
jgi:hypothetical protein